MHIYCTNTIGAIATLFDLKQPTAKYIYIYILFVTLKQLVGDQI